MSSFTDPCHSTLVAEFGPERNRATILSIDDDPNISKAIECRFQAYGFDVLRAFHGEQGIWIAAREKPDLIITDLVMPLSGGEDVIGCLKSMPETRHIPIIVLTGQPNGHMRRKLRELGADEYLTKPIEFDKLRSAVALLVEICCPAG